MADVVYPGSPTGGTLGQAFLPSNFDLVLYKGDYFPFRLTLKNPDGTLVNLTGYSARAQIRESFDEPGVYSFATDIPNPSLGYVDFMLPSSTTSAMRSGTYVWDVQVTEPSGNTRTYVTGDVKVYNEVTKE